MGKYSIKKRVLVIGGKNYLGQRIINVLKNKGFSNESILTDSPSRDLRKPGDCESILKSADNVIYLDNSARGILFNEKNSARLFYDNILVGINLIEKARQLKIKKFCVIGTVCSYPKNMEIPFKEEEFWSGYPEENNAPYGLAKKILLVQLQSYKKQYGLNGSYIIPANIYGPGDLADERSSHVIPSLIIKFLKAINKGNPNITVWGTGRATRDFLYVDDAAEAIVDLFEKVNYPEPINLGSGRETSIMDLALLIKKITGYKGQIKYDISKPDGQPRRALDISKATSKIGFKPKTLLRDGIIKTVNYYKKTLKL
ncbi:hypothetical protein A2768_00020 [Candidatus Roizmanbacteria bacterium RIFCSPHIGHO2_01_FULL_37_16]|nr:MAG: hypothetical protein A2768_00020 [Candidatus Roizmanbacteria bacterium RIFCSPHIGHO2_01_FULL_37_16]